METLLNMLLKLGISPVGLSVVGLLVTWFFVIFYFLPKIQSADDCEQKLLVQINNVSKSVEELSAQFTIITEKVNTIAVTQNQVRDYFTEIYKNTEFSISQLAKLNKNMNNFVLYTVYKTDTDFKDDVVKIMMSSLFSDNNNETNDFDFRFKDMDKG